MSEITEEKYQEIKTKAVEYFGRNKIIDSPAFGKIKIKPEGFNHIEWKNKNHKRPMKEAYIRYLCFLNTAYILNHSKLYQEFREEMQEFVIKRKRKNIRENKIVNLFGFIAIVNHNKNRVKIIVKKVDGWNNYEFVSIIPVWKNSGYGPQLFFDNEEEFLKVLEEEEGLLEVTTKEEEVTKKPSS